MKSNSKTRKILSAIAVLAVSATAAVGAASILRGGNDFAPMGNSVKSTFAETVQGKTYYIAPNGTSDGDGTETNPYSAIYLLRSTDILKPGDTVLVKPGTYKIGFNVEILATGAYNGYITIKNSTCTANSSLPTERVIFDFSEMAFASENRGIEIFGDFIHWQGIDICGAGDNGMYVGGSHNIIEGCEFFNNRDSGFQLGRRFSSQTNVSDWPSYNLIKNCTSHNNYDNETGGENADGFAAKLTIGYGNVFDNCIAYRNSDDGWDLYAKSDSGNIGAVILYNCVAFENGYIEYTQSDFYTMVTSDQRYAENKDYYCTSLGDGNGFKLGGSVMEGEVIMHNCLTFNNRMHGVTDNSNPGVLQLNNVTAYNNGASVDTDPDSQYYGRIKDGITEYTPTDGSPKIDTNIGSGGNINVARQTYSYNTLNKVLSVSDDLAGSGYSADEYRGSVVDSLLTDKSNSYKVEGAADLDTQNSNMGTKGAKLVATEIFEKLPTTKTTADTVTYAFDLSGLNDYGTYNKANKTFVVNAQRVHIRLRNADGSVQMGDYFKIKDYTKLLGDNNKIGADFTKTSYSAYTHYNTKEMLNDQVNEAAAVLEKVAESLYINTDTAACYQDFDVLTSVNTGIGVSKKLSEAGGGLGGRVAQINWSSSKPEILSVSRKYDNSSISKSEYTTVFVTRPATDTDVTLTATITYAGQSLTKAFTITVKADAPAIGAMYVDGALGKISAAGSLIVDQYQVMQEPKLYVENAADYNGKFLREGSAESGGQYTVSTKYEYSASKGGAKIEVPCFTTSKAGVFTITHTVTLNSNNSTSTYSYTIFVSSKSANVDFLEVEGNKGSIAVTRDGYIISGSLANATGILYSASSATQVQDIDADKFKALNPETYEFRAESISHIFENENSGGYYIYYALGNLNGDITSDIYEKQVTTVNIGNAADLKTVLQGGKLSGENPATTIYSLTTDIDCTSTTWTSSGKFSGMLNGHGFKISNITLTGSGNDVGIIKEAIDATIMNVKFDNITITGGTSRTGIIAKARGGYFDNIAITNIKVTGADRIGGLIGQIYDGNKVEITQVSLVNQIENVNDVGDFTISNPKYIGSSSSTGQRVGGLVGFTQSDNPAKNPSIDVYFADCYVVSNLIAPKVVGGILGEENINDTNCPHIITLEHCVFAGVASATGSSKHVAGMIGYAQGNSPLMKIKQCANLGQIWAQGENIQASQKNASGIVGWEVKAVARLTMTVSGCLALFEDYDAEFDVMGVSVNNISTIEFGSNYLDFDTETKWSFVYAEGTSTATRRLLKAPYITLNFINEAPAE